MKNQNTKYIVIEGVEGVGKTTQIQEIKNALLQMNYSVLATKEPGINLLPITMQLRNLMLNADYESHLTPQAREYISQAIRSIHLNKLIAPSLLNNEVDFIIQDRGVLSGIGYGINCGNDKDFILNLSQYTCNQDMYYLYDTTIFLDKDPIKSLSIAKNSKQEFTNGDAMENKGIEFILNTRKTMLEYGKKFRHFNIVNVEDKTIPQVTEKLMEIILNVK